MAIRLIAMDVDGTMIDTPDNMQIHPRVLRAVAEAVRRGILVCIASGRNFAYAEDYLKRSGVNGPLISCNGASVLSAGRVYFKKTLDPAMVEFSYRFSREYGMNPMAFTDHEIYFPTYGSAEADQRFIDAYTCDGTGAQAFHPISDEEYLALAGRADELIKMSIITYDSEAHMRRALAAWEALRAEGRIPGDPDCAVSFWCNFEVMPNGVSKGAGLMELVKVLGIDRSEVMAIGDNENDIEMIQVAGIGVAMGNAVERLKAAADHVTLSVKEGGAGVAIEKFALLD